MNFTLSGLSSFLNLALALVCSCLVLNPLWAQDFEAGANSQASEAQDKNKKEETKAKKPKASSSSKYKTNFKVRSEVAIEKDMEYINLVVGVYKDIKFEDLPDGAIFKLENTKYKRYADIIYDNERKVMRFKPKRKGRFTLRFINKKRPHLILKQVSVFVQTGDLAKMANEIKNLLKEIEGIEIKVINNKVVVDGYILLAKDMNRIAAVLNQYDPKKVASIVRLSPLTKRKIAGRIEQEIDNPNIYVDVINNFYVLEGEEKWAGEKERAERIAQTHISDTLEKFAVASDRGGAKIRPVLSAGTPVINNIRPVPPPKPPRKKIIQVVVHYVELSKDYSRGFNFSWAPTIVDNYGEVGGIPVSPNSNQDFFSGFKALISNLLPRLNWARKHGHARVLNTMNVLVEEGSQGTVDSSAQVQQTLANTSGLSTNTVNAGIRTTVTPTTDPESPDNIRMQIDIRITEFLGGVGAGLATVGNNLNTVVSVRNKQSAAIGGLLKSKSSTTYNKGLPPGDNRLFNLGASKDLTRENSQFVVFVTPIEKPTASQGVERVKKKFRIDK